MSGRSRTNLIRIGLALLGILVGGVTAEIGLRVYARFGGEMGRRLAASDPLGVLIEPLGAVGYRQRPFAVQRYANGTVARSNSLGFRGPEIERTKPDGVIRIVLLGGSTTHGWSVADHETISAHMQAMLDSLAPGRRFEVVNAALDGYDSYQLLERLRIDVLPLRPDFVVINSGINDVRNARYQQITDADSRTLLWEGVLERLRLERAEGPLLWSVVKHHSLLMRLPGFLRRREANPMAHRAADTRGGEAPASDSGRADAVPYTPDAADYFERNLRRIAELATRHRVRLIFSTPPSSLRLNYVAHDRSVRNYWIGDAETTANYRDSLAARMRAVAAESSARGTPIPYLRPTVPATEFLDDAHLTSEGYRAVAASVVAEIIASLRSTP